MEAHKVKLISITPDAETTIMRCARVSSNDQTSDDPKLIKYCIKHGHYSILEMANMCIEIETSRAISAQIIRHKSFSFQEFSQRYQKVPSFKTYEARRQDPKNRQNSVDDLSEDTMTWFRVAQQGLHQKCADLYQEALDKNIAKEQARFLLPMGSSTKLYMNGTIRSWVHYLQLRRENGTQLEHIDIANKCIDIFKEELPTISEALEWK
jgi:thymidylate synthase (FAD)